MRFIHEIDGEMQSTAGGSLYSKGKEQEKSSGFRVEVLACTAPGQRWAEDEVIEIQGDAKHVLAMLEDLADMIRSCAEAYIEDGRMDPDWNKGDVDVPKDET